ncbi:iron ABC transporter substrate-binding protein [Glycomyces sp. NRRL B-16210]|uniref:iron ABC transporter substrate-binding protein n=1 Tax=Glycomyces sp. NRRL B-16210 TaxID=1463821 RepID=UPI0004BED9AA|nr:iron ABC transporter substrate-binding protein [Glycomyces sp. NRRL B-16210]
MRHPIRRAIPLTVAAALAATGLAACGSGDASDDATGSESAAESDQSITVYSGRSEDLVQPLLDQFTDETGIEIEVRYDNSATMATQILEEGDRSPADVFFSQDAGALGAVAKEGLFAELPAEVLDLVPAQYSAGTGEWVGVTARARVLVYNVDLVDEADLPESVFDLTDPEWKGAVGVAPTNASFQAFVTAIRVEHGDEAAEEFLAGLVANDPEIRDGNGGILEEVNNGDLATGLINHYYVGELAAEQGVALDELDARLHFFPGGDTGGLVNVAGVGVLEHAAEDPDVRAFVDFLLSQSAQEAFATQTYEYPLVEGVAGPEGLPTLDSLEAPEIDLNDLDTLEATIAMITASGLVP